MKKCITFILLILGFSFFGIPTFSNSNHIQFSKIPNHQEYTELYKFIIDHVEYYDHWTPGWEYKISKRQILKQLKLCYKTFSRLDNNNPEVNLLLGDIAHYLYNLNQENYFLKAEKHYKKAIELSPNDYRVYWFIGNHYALSAVQDKAIQNYILARDILPKEVPVAFWLEFTFATLTTNMTSHSIYAMDKTKEILGEAGHLEKHLGEKVRQRLLKANIDSTYDLQTLWDVNESEVLTFISRPMGLKFMIDPDWGLDLIKYENRKALIAITPPAIENKDGRPITYTIAVIVNVFDEDVALKGFTRSFITDYSEIKELKITDKFAPSESIDIKVNYMYADIGGAHLNLIGLKRAVPKYPGLLLEEPMALPKDIPGELSIYTPESTYNRFDGNIYYMIMLDTCEDIYGESFVVFKDFIENQLIIE